MLINLLVFVFTIKYKKAHYMLLGVGGSGVETASSIYMFLRWDLLMYSFNLYPAEFLKMDLS